MNMNKSGKGHISVTILQITFFVNFFKTSHWIWNQRETRKKRLKKTAQKMENLFHKYVLEFNYATIIGLVHTSC
jgi:hypothetical protein